MAALVRAAPPTGSQNPAPASQPLGDNGGKKSVSFNEVIKVFDGEGEERFVFILSFLGTISWNKLWRAFPLETIKTASKKIKECEL